MQSGEVGAVYERRAHRLSLARQGLLPLPTSWRQACGGRGVVCWATPFDVVDVVDGNVTPVPPGTTGSVAQKRMEAAAGLSDIAESLGIDLVTCVPTEPKEQFDRDLAKLAFDLAQGAAAVALGVSRADAKLVLLSLHLPGQFFDVGPGMVLDRQAAQAAPLFGGMPERQRSSVDAALQKCTVLPFVVDGFRAPLEGHVAAQRMGQAEARGFEMGRRLAASRRIEMKDHYICATHDTVEFWSARRLPLEPKGELLEGKKKLKAELKKLRAREGQHLDALYQSNDTRFFDVENVLFYNVGSGAFGNSCRHGLHFRRQTGAPPPRPDGGASEHYHRYAVVDDDAGASVANAESAASFSFTISSLSSSTKPHSVWWAMKQGDVSVRTPTLLAGAFALVVDVTAPRGKQPNLSAVLKPLFDGIISALQVDDAVGPLAVARLAAMLREDEGAVAFMLGNKEHAAIAGGELLNAYRDGVKWNPADDNCWDGRLSLTQGKSAEWTIHGKLVALDS